MAQRGVKMTLSPWGPFRPPYGSEGRHFRGAKIGALFLPKMAPIDMESNEGNDKLVSKIAKNLKKIHGPY